jgi:hypothetical protein
MKNLKIALALLVLGGVITKVFAGRSCRHNGRRTYTEGCSRKSNENKRTFE